MPNTILYSLLALTNLTLPISHFIVEKIEINKNVITVQGETMIEVCSPVTNPGSLIPDIILN